MIDPVVKLAKDHIAIDIEPLVQFGLKYAGVLARTPSERIQRAVVEEVADLVKRARAAVAALVPTMPTEPALTEALAVLGDETKFPRDALHALAEMLRAEGRTPALAEELEAWVGRHRALERRVKWLLDGTPPHKRAALDPIADCDEVHHTITSAFRFEARILETLAINRIAQSATIGTFFRSTKEAEKNSVMRFFDTYALYANVFEWGVDSLRGRTAAERMNQIHGRYYIPNDEMKFVLLQGVFTWLDGADRIGHRPITDKERRGMLASWVRMGQAMNIQDLTFDYDAMYAWYRSVCEATKDFDEKKKATFETIVLASLSGQLPNLRDGLVLASKVAMDDTYRQACGYPEPTRDEKSAVRAVFFTVGSLIEQLPYTPYVRSLQNNPARRAWTDPKDLGAPERSTHMPPAFADKPNRGFPEWQKPLAAGDPARPMDLPEIGWDVVRQKAEEGQLWLVVDGFVLDLTTMRDVHPGGAKILEGWAGRDASRAFRAAKHAQGTLIFALNFRIGRIAGEATTGKDVHDAIPAAPAADGAVAAAPPVGG